MTVHDRTRLTGQLHLFSGADDHDVFNGDADGICALHQLRLAFPVVNDLVTGTKRDINLLPEDELSQFMQAFDEAFPATS